jgi:hypothetical protein
MRNHTKLLVRLSARKSSRHHHAEAYSPEQHGSHEGVGLVEAVQCSDEPEKPGYRELRLARELAQLDDQRDEERSSPPDINLSTTTM